MKYVMAGLTLVKPAIESTCANSAARSLSSADAATSPREAAAAAATGAATTATAPATAATTAASTAASPPGELLAQLGLCSVFFIENIEGRQAHVGDFFLTEEDLVRRREILRLNVSYRSASRCGRSAGQREGYAGNPGDSQSRQGLPPTSSLRSLLRARHFSVLPYFRANGSVTRDALPDSIPSREPYACSTACSISEA